MFINLYVYDLKKENLLYYKENIKTFDNWGDIIFLNLNEYLRQLYNGDYQLEIEFLEDIIVSNKNSLIISDISNDRTEIIVKIKNKDLEKNFSFINIVNKFFNQNAEIELYDENGLLRHFFIRIIKNNNIYDYVITNWFKIDKYTFAIKLKESLEEDIVYKDELNIYRRRFENVINYLSVMDKPKEKKIIVLEGVNTNINVDNKKDKSNYYNYVQIKNEINNITEVKDNLKLLIDYSKYENFIFYSSAYNRIKNFEYKCKKYFTLKNKLLLLNNNTSEYFRLKKEMERILLTFTDYEKYLWNKEYPKDNNEHINFYDTIVQQFFIAKISSAKDYDNNNKNILIKALPQYLINDNNNQLYITFISMIGEFFDDIYLYIKNFENLKDFKENVDKGLSKELIKYVLKNFGFNIYSNFDNVNLSEYSEGINLKKYEYEIWKRILNNLPYLYKTKGTREAIYSLLNIFGIPHTILLIGEYGGKRVKQNYTYYNYDRFAYKLMFNHSYNSYISIKTKFRAMQFRFYPLFYGNNDITIVNSNNFYIKIKNENTIEIKLGSQYINFDNVKFNEWYILHIGIKDKNYTENIEIGDKIIAILISYKKGKLWDLKIKEDEINNNDIIELMNNTIYEYKFGNNYNGYMQEIRFYKKFIGLNNIKYSALCPIVISTGNLFSTINDVIIRLPLGTDLNIYDLSLANILPNQAPNQQLPSQIFNSLNGSFNNSFNFSFELDYYISNNNFPSEGNFVPFTETYYQIISNYNSNHLWNNKINILNYIETKNYIFENGYYVTLNNTYDYVMDGLEDNQINEDFFYPYNGGSFNYSYDNSFETDVVDDFFIIPVYEFKDLFSLSPFIKRFYNEKYLSNKNNKIQIGFSISEDNNLEIYSYLGQSILDNELYNKHKGLYTNLIYMYYLILQKNKGKNYFYKYLSIIEQYNKTLFFYLNQLLPLNTTIISGLTIDNNILIRQQIIDMDMNSKINYVQSKITDFYNFEIKKIHKYNMKVLTKFFKYPNNDTPYIINGELVLSKRPQHLYRTLTNINNKSYFKNYLWNKLSYIKLRDNAIIESEQIDNVIEDENYNELVSDITDIQLNRHNYIDYSNGESVIE